MKRCSRTLVNHPCCIETISKNVRCAEGTSVFACGAYELKNEGSSESRIGSISLYSIQEENLDSQQNQNTTSIKLLSGVNCGSSGGVLDMKAINFQLIAAMSSSAIDIYGWRESEDDISLQKLDSASKSGEGLFLSVDSFAEIDEEGSGSTGESVLATSTQNGSILIYQCSSSGVTELQHIPAAHVFLEEAMPVWVVTMNGCSRNQIVSGGDDCKLKIWDIRESSTVPTHTVSRKYDAGVTSAQWHPRMDHIFAAGSYDQSVCIWDHRYMKTELLRYSTVGGVWRIKWIVADDLNDEFILTANMQGGSSILKLNPTTDESNCKHCYSLNDVATFSNGSEGQLVYGVGHFQESKSNIIIEEGVSEKKYFDFVSCSFYENSIEVWTAAI